MAVKFRLTKDVCRKIVESAGDRSIDHRQTIRKGTVIPRQKGEGGHYVGTMSSLFTQNSNRDAYGQAEISDGVEIDVYCPLLQSGEQITQGTSVMMSRNLSNGHWDIFAIQCSTATQAILPGQEENFTDPDETDNPEVDNDEEI